jgi:hypothetical protein
MCVCVCAPQDIKTAGALLLAWLVVDNSPDAVCGDRKQTYSNYFRSFGIIPLMSCVHLRRSRPPPPHTHTGNFSPGRSAAAKARAPNKSLCALLPVRLLFSRLAPKLSRPKIKCTHFCPRCGDAHNFTTSVYTTNGKHHKIYSKVMDFKENL